MNRISIGGGTLTLILAVGLALPSPARAGDKEWARAGKVLTGLVVVGALTQAIHAAPPPPVCVMERTVFVGPPVTWAPRYDAGPAGYDQNWTLTYETRYFQGRRMERCPRVRGRHGHPPREIVLPYGHGRRLYQPGVRGHQAFIQQWSPRDGRWVVIGGHPSLWR